MSGLRQISIVALIVSWIVDIVGTNVIALLYFMWGAATGRVDPAKLTDQRAPMADPDVFLTLMLVGTAVSVAAGYLAARMAGRAPLLHGVLSSVGGIAAGLLTLQTTLESTPLGLVLAGFAAGPIAGVAGGYVELRHARIRARSAG